MYFATFHHKYCNCAIFVRVRRFLSTENLADWVQVEEGAIGGAYRPKRWRVYRRVSLCCILSWTILIVPTGAIKLRCWLTAKCRCEYLVKETPLIIRKRIAKWRFDCHHFFWHEGGRVAPNLNKQANNRHLQAPRRTPTPSLTPVPTWGLSSKKTPHVPRCRLILRKKKPPI